MKILPIPARCGAVRLAAVLLLALSCTAVLASGHIVDVAWDPSGRFNHSATVPPGKFVEVCGRLDSGMKVRWEFDAVAPMDFNIHYHVGKDAVFPAKQAQVAKESPSFGRGDSRAADNRRPGAVGQALGTRSSKPPN